MSVDTFSDGVLSGLALFLLGAWLLQEGVARSAGSLLKRALATRVRERHHAWGLGALLGLVVPITETSSRTLAGLSNTGLIAPRLALWAAAGHGAGLAGVAWVFALLARNHAGSALALALVAGGVAAMWTAPERSRGAIGRGLAGWGLLLLGMVLLAEGFEHGRGVLVLDGFAGGLLLRSLALGLVGFALSVALRSGGAAAVLAAAAASSGVITDVSAVAMALGGGLGAGGGVLLALESLTAVARRAAVGLIALHVVGLACGAVLLACSLPLLTHAVGPFADPATAIALVLTLSLVGPALCLRGLEQQLVARLSQQFLAAEQEQRNAQQVDGSLAIAPELAVTALLREAGRQNAVARKLAAAVVSRELLTSRREAADRATIGALAQVIEGSVADLAQRALTPAAAGALPGVLRASQAAWELGEQAAFLNDERLADEGPLGPTLEARVTRLQLDLQRLLDSASPAGDEAACALLEGGLAELEGRMHEIRCQAVQRCARGELDALGLERAIERLSTLRRIAQLGVDSTLDLARALPAARAAEPDPEAQLEAALATL